MATRLVHRGARSEPLRQDCTCLLRVRHGHSHSLPLPSPLGISNSVLACAADGARGRRQRFLTPLALNLTFTRQVRLSLGLLFRFAPLLVQAMDNVLALRAKTTP
eukprot:4253901-Pleurochrysis_carterae.AAC.1